MKISEILVKKRDGTTEKFNEQKIIEAVNKSASRVMKKLSVDDYEKIIELVLDEIFELSSDRDEENFSVEDMHNAVEYALESCD